MKLCCQKALSKGAVAAPLWGFVDLDESALIKLLEKRTLE